MEVPVRQKAEDSWAHDFYFFQVCLLEEAC